MKDGTSIEQRSVVLLPFPFTDLTSSKKRPALVVSNTEFNRKSEDVICCLITSNPNAKDGVRIANKDMESGFLEFESTVKPYRLFTANKAIIYKVLGKLNKEKSVLVVTDINKMIKIQ
jgi:mRNA interferase MazF